MEIDRLLNAGVVPGLAAGICHGGMLSYHIALCNGFCCSALASQQHAGKRLPLIADGDALACGLDSGEHVIPLGRVVALLGLLQQRLDLWAGTLEVGKSRK